jgi:hypothetical protein
VGKLEKTQNLLRKTGLLKEFNLFCDAEWKQSTMLVEQAYKQQTLRLKGRS